MNKKIAIYPGTFDPFTFGHLDIAERACKICDKLIIALAIDNGKQNLFLPEIRAEIVKAETKHLEVEVALFSGLLVNFAKEKGAHMLIRGLRAVSDFEYEFQMSCMNMKLDEGVQTVFLPASEKTHFIASRLVKEVARLGGDVSGFVSKDVEKRLKNYYSSALT